MVAKKLTFEQSLARLDEIVKALEKGDRPLEEALGLFEEGTGLIRACGKVLDQAEQKIVTLSRGPDGEPVETPFREAE